jgi:alpha-tubulin suppressor-like RCC1 family protein
MLVNDTPVWLRVSFMAAVCGCGSSSSSTEAGPSRDSGDASLAPDVASIIIVAPDVGEDSGAAGMDASAACTPTDSSTPAQCSNNTPQFCDGNGQWTDIAGGPCSGATPFCLSGACVACAPRTSAAQCTDATTLQTCEADGTWSASPCPTLCKNGACLSATNIFMGRYDACALLSDTSLACWGDNAYGQLANGSFTGPSTCGSLPCATAPIPIAGLTGATDMAIGFKFACSAFSDGTAKCWGRGVDGVLGNAMSTPPDVCSGFPCSMTPVTVSGLSGVKTITAGDNHACALLDDGDVWCWGANDYGQLGYGSASGPTTCSNNGSTIDCAIAPVSVQGLHGATAIAAGRLHTCALLGDGTVSCWGQSSAGQLGNGACSGPNTCTGTASVDCATSAVKVPGLTNVTAITSLDYATCALRTDNSLQCWGTFVENGVNGDAATCGTGVLTTPSLISGSAGIASIAPYCVLTTNGAVECWGDNTFGQLGNGTITASTGLVPVSGLSGTAREVTSSAGTACAVLSSGALSCWGDNGYGTLGIGTAGLPSDCGEGLLCSTTPVSVLW